MSKHNRHIALMEKLLIHLKNTKLGYLKAADNATVSVDKRFFHQQAVFRNRFFQEILAELQLLGMQYDDLVISKFKFDQLLISSIETLKATAVEKCLEADHILLKIYHSLFEEGYENEKFLHHISSLEVALEQTQALAKDYSNKKVLNS